MFGLTLPFLHTIFGDFSNSAIPKELAVKLLFLAVRLLYYMLESCVQKGFNFYAFLQWVNVLHSILFN